MRNLGRGVLAAASVAVCVVGIHATSHEASAKPGPKVCPEVYAPVICSNGRVYVNQCYADKARATGCVPYGDL
jgi:hypothetical protein